MNKAMILVVEDDSSVRNLITTTLKTHDYKYITAENGKNAIMEASSYNPDIPKFADLFQKITGQFHLFFAKAVDSCLLQIRKRRVKSDDPRHDCVTINCNSTHLR